MVTALLILTVLIAILLVLVVLAQNSKGGSFASNFSASNQLIGVKKTGDLLEKLTWGFAIAIMTFSLVINLVIETPDVEGQMGTPATRSAKEQPMPQIAAPPAAEQPQGPAGTQPNANQAAPANEIPEQNHNNTTTTPDQQQAPENDPLR